METTQTLAVITQAPLVRNASETRLKQIIAQTYFRKGTGIEPQTLDLVVKDMKQIIFDEFNYLTIEEVAFALKEGVLGKYGTYFGVNIQTMYEWLSKYSASDERIAFIQKANMERALKALPPPQPKSDEEVWQEIRQVIIGKFNDYKATKRFNQWGSFVYNSLIKRGILKPTAEEKWAVYNECIAHERKLEKACPTKPCGIVAFSEMQIVKEKNIKDRAVHRSKDRLVTNFFDDVIASGGEITDYI